MQIDLYVQEVHVSPYSQYTCAPGASRLCYPTILRTGNTIIHTVDFKPLRQSVHYILPLAIHHTPQYNLPVRHNKCSYVLSFTNNDFILHSKISQNSSYLLFLCLSTITLQSEVPLSSRVMAFKDYSLHASSQTVATVQSAGHCMYSRVATVAIIGHLHF